MKKIIITYFLVALALVFLWPKNSLGFSCRGDILGIDFSGSEIFKINNLYPGINVCKEVTVSNFSDNVQPLSFTAQGFNTNEKVRDFFGFFNFIIKDANQIYINKVANQISADTNNPEKIVNLAANSNQILIFCVEVSPSMGNEFQGFSSGSVDFIFGILGEETLPPISVFSPAESTGVTAGPSTTVESAPLPTIAGEQIIPPKKEAVQGEVAGETNNQNMCCNWDWCCILPWVLSVILLFWLIGMWVSDRKRRQSKEDL